MLGSAKSKTSSDVGHEVAEQRQVDAAVRAASACRRAAGLRAVAAARRPSGPATGEPSGRRGRACRRRRASRRGSPRRRAGAGCMPPDQAVGRVDRRGSPASYVRAELVGPAQHDLADQLLDRPAVARRTGRPGGRAARGATAASPVAPKLSTRADEPLAEQVLPDAVDHHPRASAGCRGWSATRPVPAGRSASGRSSAASGTSSTDRKPRGTTGAELLGLAADADRGVADRLGVADAAAPSAPRAAGSVRAAQLAPGARPSSSRTGRCFGRPFGAAAGSFAASPRIAPRTAGRRRLVSSPSFACVEPSPLGGRRRRLRRRPAASEQRRVVVVQPAAAHLVRATPAAVSVLRKMPARA